LRSKAYEADYVVSVANSPVVRGNIEATKQVTREERLGYLAPNTPNGPLKPETGEVDFKAEEGA
jgi:hypothetical protein